MTARTQPDPAPRLHLRLLGGWSLTTARDSGNVGVGESARRLITVLALRGSMGRTDLRAVLWPDLGRDSSSHRLRNALWTAAHTGVAPVETGSWGLSLAPDVSVDVHDLFRAAAAIDGVPARSAGEEVAAVPFDGDHSLFAADLLPGWEEDWLVVDRERVLQARLHALERMSAIWLAEGRHGVALDAALAALHADPLRESAHRAVIRVHLAEDNVVAAVRAFDRCRAVLADELGIDPSAALLRLMTGTGVGMESRAGAGQGADTAADAERTRPQIPRARQPRRARAQGYGRGLK